MRQFVHARVQRLGKLLARSVTLQAELREQSLEFEQDASAWLAEGTKAFEDLGLQSQAATLSRLQTEFDLVTRGIDARLLVRVETHRRQFRQAGYSRVLGSAQTTIQEAFTIEEQVLDAARAQLGKILMAALQSKLFDQGDLAAARDQGTAEKLWAELLSSEPFELPTRQLLLVLIDTDATLLLAEAARRLYTTSAPQPQAA